MNKREKIIAIVMIAMILIWGLTRTRKPRMTKKQAAPQGQARRRARRKVKKMVEPPKISTTNLKNVVEQISVRSEPVDIDSAKDPFKRIELELEEEVTTSGVSDLVLSGIIWEQETPVALINDNILKEGDSVLGFKVISISQNEVAIGKGKDKYVLELFTEPETK